MHFVVIFLALILLIFMVKWSLAQPKEKLEKAWSDIVSPFSLKTKDWATPLKTWAEVSLEAELPLKTWLLALSNEGLQALGEKIADFGMEMNVDLTWLSDPAAEIEPTTKKNAEEMVIDYCKICYKAVQNQAK